MSLTRDERIAQLEDILGNAASRVDFPNRSGTTYDLAVARQELLRLQAEAAAEAGTPLRTRLVMAPGAGIR